MKKRFVVLSILVLLLAYFLFFPVEIRPGKWQPAEAPALAGDYAPNNRLAKLQHRFNGQCHHCEDIAVDSAGYVYGGSVEGAIIRLKGEERTILAETGGRPLGLDFDTLGNLWIADADKGLLRLSPDGQIQSHSTTHGKRPFLFADDLEIASDGMIYFSDASDRFGFHKFTLELLEHQPNGRLLSYNPSSGETQLLLDQLYFANGIAVSHDGRFVLVNETGKYRVSRYWLKGPKKGQQDIFIDNLPGYPDGISQGANGIFWLTLISPRRASLDQIMDKPFLRKIIVRLPKSLRPAPERYGFILGLDQNGQIKYNLQDPNGKYAQISSVQQFGDKLYLGSLAENGVGVFDLTTLSE
ncbi:MAG: SMP-30/gluconolactonase/LRE family protein [Bacteroidota bacterium]